MKINPSSQSVAAVKRISLVVKKAFLAAMSEDDFRDRVVHPLFVEKGMEFGKDVCGIDEQGKDCYFWVQHPVVGRTLTVVQTKRGKLNLARKPKENVEEAATQMRTAIATKVSNPANGTEILPASAILVASGEINTAARQHITSKVNDGRLSFLDVDDIIPMIDDLMPEFWNGIDADKLPYLKNLRSDLVEQSETIDVSEIGINAGTPSPITDETFVQLYLHRYKTRLKKHNQERTEQLEIEEIKVQDLLTHRDSLFLMTGDAGAGKTTSLRRLAMIAIDRALDKPDSILPVCLSADMLTDPKDSVISIATAVTRSKSREDRAAFISADLEDGRVIFLIDGLDELPGEDERHAALESIKACHQKYPKSKIILTSRDYPFIHEVLEEYAFHRYQITPLSFRQAGRMIERLSKGKSLSSNETQEMLRRLENVHGLQLNPLLVTIFVATSDYARTDIPANITELFKKFTEIMLGRWHKSNALGQQFHQPLKDFILRRLAFRMHSEKRTSILLSECRALIEKELVERDHKTDFETLFHEVVYLSGLLRIEDDEVMFRHMMLQEFFAGRGIESAEFLADVVTDVWWTKALVFYFGENPDDRNALDALRSGVDKIIGGNQFQAAVAVGLACQACYLIRSEDKKDALRWVINLLAHVKAETVAHFAEEHGEYELLPILHYFIYGRDSVAGKIIREVADECWKEMASKESLTDDEETRLFWCIAGLIEARQLDAALEIIKKYNPKDDRLLLGLHLGAFYVQRIHIADKGDKKLAEKICKVIGPKVEHLHKKVIKEMKGVLIEVRGGRIKSIESDTQPD
jgi:hypothetical protein